MGLDHFWTSIVTIATALIGVAIIAVLVSNNSNTGGVIKAATGGFAQDLAAATAPVTGNTQNPFNNFGSSSYQQGY